MSMTHNAAAVLVLLATGSALPVAAETPADFRSGFEQAARAADAGFSGLSAARGEQFFTQAHGGDWSCASCHTRDPAATGRHAKTNKPIDPLAPTANPKRFTNPAKVEKWFRRNCNDVVGRACTAQEKGDVLAWLLTFGN